MNPSENIQKKKPDFSNKIRYFLSKQASKQSRARNSVKSGKALSDSYAGRSPPLWHKESGRRFLFFLFIAPTPALRVGTRKTLN